MIVAAMYKMPGAESQVCLGLRIGGPDEVASLSRRLVKQVQSRFPEFFEGMTAGQVRRKIQLSVYDEVPEKREFPRYLGDASWWT